MRKFGMVVAVVVGIALLIIRTGLVKLPFVLSDAPFLPTPGAERGIPMSPGLANTYLSNLSIRIDSVRILNDDGDPGEGGEALFAVILVRDNGAMRSSRKMVAPATGYYAFKTGDTINLGDYSLTANQVANSERIEVFILGYEDDEMGTGSKLINTAIDTLTDGLVSRALPTQEALSQLAGGLLPGELLAWWRQQELLGEYIMVLNQSNDWNIGTHTVRSTNGNLDITYTILRSTELQELPGDTVTLIIRNDSSQTIHTVYLWPSDADSWRNRASIEIRPGAAESFALEKGVYDLRAEGADGLYWEQAAIDLAKDQTWTISR